jgi:hypothetical protein
LIPVYSNAKFTATIPLTEDYARTVITLYKPNICSNADLKGKDETWVACLHRFLSGEDKQYVPLFVIDSIKRAHLKDIAGIMLQAGKKSNTGDRPVEHDIDHNFENRGIQSDAAEDIFESNEYSEFEIPEASLDLAAEGYTPVGELEEIRKLYPSFEDMEKFINKISTDYNGSSDRIKFKLNMNKKNASLYLDPIAAINNTGQRIVLCQFLKFLKRFCAWQDNNKSGEMPILLELLELENLL